MNSTPDSLRLGTRGSKLALWQSEHVRAHLAYPAELVIIKTEGDRFLDAALQTQNGKGFFTKEIEEALLDRRIDLAVHSLKDLPTDVPEGLCMGAILKRAPVADLLLVRPDAHAPDLRFPVIAGGRVGASSLRRQALLARYAPTLKPALLRGNVPTRLEKLRQGDYEAIILAEAGLTRLGLDLTGLHAYRLDPARWLPAPAQGAMAIEIRTNDAQVAEAVGRLHDDATARAVALERRLLSRFEGGCHAAFGAWAFATDENAVEVYVGHEDRAGSFRFVRVVAAWDEAERVGYAALAAALADSAEPHSEDEASVCQPFPPSC